MKKISLLLIILISISFLMAHEVSFKYSVYGKTSNQNPEETISGWELANASLTWGGNEFSDYEATYSFQTYEFTSAWKRFTLNKNMNLTLGLKRYPFGRIKGASCCAGGSESISIFSLEEPYVNWLADLEGTIYDINWNLYVANALDNNPDMGLRLSYEFSGIKLGTGILLRELKKVDPTDDFTLNYHANFVDYEFDIEYTFVEMINIAMQATNLDDEDKDTNDLRGYIIAKYSPGVELPLLGKTTPYLGYVTKRNTEGNAMEENNKFIGLNFTPLNGTYIKLEYNIDSIPNVKDKVDLQVGYVF